VAVRVGVRVRVRARVRVRVRVRLRLRLGLRLRLRVRVRLSSCTPAAGPLRVGEARPPRSGRPVHGWRRRGSGALSGAAAEEPTSW
jgi:hypothetical protein